MIISVGYRIKSKIATHFRQWATVHLREYIIKGFVLDDERLKNPHQPFDYFDELIHRIQDIRTSERRFYQKITDIYATSVDYDPTDDMSIDFFKKIQNQLKTEKPFRDYFEGNSDKLPTFYLDIIKKDLGYMYKWLPEGAIKHDHHAYLNKNLTKPEKAIA